MRRNIAQSLKTCFDRVILKNIMTNIIIMANIIFSIMLFINIIKAELNFLYNTLNYLNV